MPPEPLTLGFDTSAAHCAAALVRGDTVLAEQFEPMAKGQAERLFGLLDEVLKRTGTEWKDLDRIGVGTGPGNFTGIRISVAAARGLSLSLETGAIGISRFEAQAWGVPRPVWSLIEAPRGCCYACRLEPGTMSEPLLLDPAGKDRLLAASGVPVVQKDARSLALNIARLAATRPKRNQLRPAPVYVRPADAAPPRDTPPVIL